MPNLIPDLMPWMQPAGRLLWGVGLLVIGLLIVGALMRRPKPDRPATWAECMAGAVGVFALMTLAYAIIPHEWITFSDKYLMWDTRKYVFQSGQQMLFFPWNWPFTMDYQAIRDIFAVGIYAVLFGLNLAIFAKWQKRTTADAAPPVEKTKTSRFGRPLRRGQGVPEPEPAPAATATAAAPGTPTGAGA